MRSPKLSCAAGRALGRVIVVAAVLSPSAPVCGQTPLSPVIWEIDVELWEDDGVTGEVRQSAAYGDYGDVLSGSQMMDWHREHTNGVATGGVTATWDSEFVDLHTARLTWSLDNTYQYSHNGGWPYLIFGGHGRLVVTPWVRGPARTRTTTRITNIAEADGGTVTVTGLVCGGGTWIYRQVNQTSGDEWVLNTCDEAIMVGTALYTKSYMTPSSQSSITFGRTGPNLDPFVHNEHGRISISFEIEICPADVNNSGGLTTQDIFDFLAAYFGGEPAGDFNGTDGHTVQDIFDFLAAYFAGCP